MAERAAALEKEAKLLKEARHVATSSKLKVYKESGVGKYIDPKMFAKKSVSSFSNFYIFSFDRASFLFGYFYVLCRMYLIIDFLRINLI